LRTGLLASLHFEFRVRAPNLRLLCEEVEDGSSPNSRTCVSSIALLESISPVLRTAANAFGGDCEQFHHRVDPTGGRADVLRSF
jgi:hypothetical protein